jgi:hypothetical protein
MREDAMLDICKTERALKGVQSGQSGQGPVLDRSEHLPVYRWRGMKMSQMAHVEENTNSFLRIDESWIGRIKPRR